jgi:hypothetical protein
MYRPCASLIRTDQDFEKGEVDGMAEALSILEAILQGTHAE